MSQRDRPHQHRVYTKQPTRCPGEIIVYIRRIGEMRYNCEYRGQWFRMGNAPTTFTPEQRNRDLEDRADIYLTSKYFTSRDIQISDRAFSLIGKGFFAPILLDS